MAHVNGLHSVTPTEVGLFLKHSHKDLTYSNIPPSHSHSYLSHTRICLSHTLTHVVDTGTSHGVTDMVSTWSSLLSCGGDGRLVRRPWLL